jgi:hypothetical protein
VNQLSFQALLKDSTGNLVQGPVDLAFQFYGSMGQPVSNPITLSNVPVSNGIVSTAIPIQDGVFDGTGRTLGVSVNGTPELSPRIPLTSAPQSFRVNCAAGEELVDHLDLGGPQTSGMLRIFGPPIPDSGSVAAAGPAAIAAQVNRAVDAFAPPCGGSYVLSTFTPHETVELYACSHGGGGSALLSNHLGQRTIALVADGDYEAGEINLYNSREEPKKTIYLSAGSGQYDYDGSMIILSKATGERTIVLNGEGRDASLSEGGFGTLSGGGFLVLGAPTRENVAIDNNEIMARNNWGTAPLYLNYEGGNIIMIRSGTGNVGIGTSSPGQKLTVNGTIESTSGGIKFPDGTVQATATLRGERGSRGADGADGADGAPGPAVTTFVVCENGVEAGTTCVNLCGGSEKVEGGAAGECSVSSDTGPCSALSGGLCCVCSP